MFPFGRCQYPPHVLPAGRPIWASSVRCSFSSRCPAGVGEKTRYSEDAIDEVVGVWKGGGWVMCGEGRFAIVVGAMRWVGKGRTFPPSLEGQEKN